MSALHTTPPPAGAVVVGAGAVVVVVEVVAVVVVVSLFSAALVVVATVVEVETLALSAVVLVVVVDVPRPFLGFLLLPGFVSERDVFMASTARVWDSKETVTEDPACERGPDPLLSSAAGSRTL